eukprot:262578_1
MTDEPKCKPFLCFNCQVRIPGFGETKWEMVLTTITLLLFALSFVEIIALAQFSKAFSAGTANGCCGVIEEKSWPAAGAICHEDNIQNSKLQKQMIDGSIISDRSYNTMIFVYCMHISHFATLERLSQYFSSTLERQ